MNRNRTKIIVSILVVTLFCTSTLFAKNLVMVKNVPIINQHPELPTGCEITALTMLLQYHGVNVSKEQLAKEITKVPVPYVSKGILYGGDPNKGFIGDPFSKRGFGVYKGGIIPLIEKYLPGRVEDLSGGDFSQVYEALDQGKPVMIWTTISMLNVDDKKHYWTTLEGKKIEWKTPEHAMVAVGYDDEYIYLNDPYIGQQRKYKKQVVINRWSEMGKQALAIKSSQGLPKVDVIKVQNAVIEDTKYIDFLTLDEQGLWIQARMLPNIFSSTSVTYDEKNYSVVIKVRDSVSEEMNLPNIQADTTINQAIPNIEQNQYICEIVLKPTEKNLITYNPQGNQVDMLYKIIDGVTYVNKEWVEQFYNIYIQAIED